jgi:hypothetical protein
MLNAVERQGLYHQGETDLIVSRKSFPEGLAFALRTLQKPPSQHFSENQRRMACRRDPRLLLP